MGTKCEQLKTSLFLARALRGNPRGACRQQHRVPLVGSQGSFPWQAEGSVNSPHHCQLCAGHWHLPQVQQCCGTFPCLFSLSFCGILILGPFHPPAVGLIGTAGSSLTQGTGEGGAGAQEGQKIQRKTTPRSRQTGTGSSPETAKIKGDLSAQDSLGG